MHRASLVTSIPVDRQVAREAAEWLVRLGSDNVGAADVAACERWRAADAEHERAWLLAQQLNEKLSAIPSRIGMPALTRSWARSRRTALKSLAVLIAAAPAAWLTVEATPWRALSADLRTATGKRRRVVLPDNSILHLNTATAVDLRFDAQQRMLLLLGGEILVETAPDSTSPPRPFLVRTQHGRLRALGTRFIVKDEAEHSRVGVLEGAVEITPNTGKPVEVLQAHQQTRFNDRAIDSPAVIAAHSADWSRGLLHADRLALRDFLAELSRHRPGVLRCDPAVAQWQISGIYQLDDTDATLRALPELLPIRVRRVNDYWIVVEPREG